MRLTRATAAEIRRRLKAETVAFHHADLSTKFCRTHDGSCALNDAGRDVYNVALFERGYGATDSIHEADLADLSLLHDHVGNELLGDGVSNPDGPVMLDLYVYAGRGGDYELVDNATVVLRPDGTVAYCSRDRTREHVRRGHSIYEDLS